MTDDTRSSVRATWETIGEHFAKTRANPWPEVETFCQPRHGKVGLDVGTGNGRHATLLTDCCSTVIGLDASQALLTTARTSTDERILYLQGDATHLPIHTATVDIGLCIAILHHLPSAEARRHCLEELGRVLTTDGEAFVSVWSTAHDRFDADTGFDTTIEWTLPDGSTVDRYYHIYAPSEFRDLLEATPITLQEFRVSSGNCYATIGSPST